MEVRWDGKKYCFTCEMEAMSPLVIQTGLSCDVVEMEAYSTGKGLSLVCTRARLGSKSEWRCEADFSEAMSCCQNTGCAMREKQSHPAVWCCLLNSYQDKARHCYKCCNVRGIISKHLLEQGDSDCLWGGAPEARSGKQVSDLFPGILSNINHFQNLPTLKLMAYH